MVRRYISLLRPRSISIHHAHAVWWLGPQQGGEKEKLSEKEQELDLVPPELQVL